MKIALITTNEIVEKIFLLVSKRLSISLDLYQNDHFEDSYDYICIDDDINLDSVSLDTNKLILLNHSLSPNSNYFHNIKKPFLPSDLQSELEYLFSKGEEDTDQSQEAIDLSHELHLDNKELDGEAIGSLNDINLESLAKNVVDGIECSESEDDLVIEKERLSNGGILDSDELKKLHEMIEDETTDNFNSFQNDSNNEDWSDLSQIVDNAIHELEVDNQNDTMILVINKQNLEEMRPLLRKLDQKSIDTLVEGQEITIQLRLEK